MKAPKILPWLARKAAISDELALSLWRRAASEAEQLAGNSNSDGYFSLAIERFADLCREEGEKLGQGSRFSNDLNSIKRYQARIVHINLLATRKIWQLWTAQWSSLVTRQKQATRT